jgi:hypothetical protein
MFRFITVLYLLAVPDASASWQYTNGTGIDTTPSGFTYQATVTENPANTFSGTAVLTAFSGSSASIPPPVTIQITVNTTNSQGQPIQYNEWVNCTVKGVNGIILNSDATWDGDVSIVGSGLNQNGNDLTVNGSVIHQAGWLQPKGGHLTISGDYLQQCDVDGDGTYESSSYGSLAMNNAADVMTVGGDAQFWAEFGNTSTSLTAGLLEIKGNFLQKTGTYSGNDSYHLKGFQASGTHRVRLSGAAAQTVTFQNPGPNASYFNILEVTNTNPLVFNSPVQASRVTGSTSISIQSSGAGGISGVLESDVTYVATSFAILSTTDLAGHTLAVNCPVTQHGSLNLNGGTLTVGAGGGWDQRESMIIGLGGTLTVAGDWVHQSGWILPDGGHLEISGDYLQQRDVDGDGTFEAESYGALAMIDPADVMTVGGDAQFWAQYGNRSISITTGLLEIKGNFLQKTGGYTGNDSYQLKGFQASGTHRVKLSGTAIQTVTFQNPGLDASYFNILEVTNPNPLVFNSPVQASRVTGNTSISIQSLGAGGISGVLESDITCVAASFSILANTDLAGHTLTVNCPVKQHGSLNLNGGTLTVGGGGGWDQRESVTIGLGGTLTVAGDWVHQSGWLSLNGGRLDIIGNYLQQRDSNGDGTYESPCEIGLSMTNTADYMLVGGDVGIWCYNSYGQSLNAGTLETKGDFVQKGAGLSDYYSSFESGMDFRASGTHRVKLSGTTTQTVTFETPGGSYFNILEVMVPLVDTSTVSVGHGGHLQLDFTSTDVVGALYLGGTQQPNGLYDATNSGGLISGTGRIQVGPFVSYAAWVAANAPAETTDQDHDHDGVANGIEYFMGKTGNDFTANPGIAADGTVTWPKSPAFSGSYAVQTSSDLVEWTDVTDDPAQVTKNSDSVVWMRPNGTGSRFVRLLVTPN